MLVAEWNVWWGGKFFCVCIPDDWSEENDGEINLWWIIDD
jgi:hypothetical protein